MTTFNRHSESTSRPARSARWAWLAPLLLAAAPAAFAQWPLGLHGTMNETAGNRSEDAVVRSRVASTGDVIIAGNFKGQLTIGSTVLNAAGAQDIFVARLGAGGNVLWARSAGSPGMDSLNGLTLDSNNNIYVVGNYSGIAEFGANAVTSSNGSQDGFVARMDFSGSWKWVKSMGGQGTDALNDVVALPGDNLVIPQIPETLVLLGTYATDTMVYLSGTSLQFIQGSSTTRSDAMLARISINDTADDSDGFWIKPLESTVRTEGLRLVADEDGRIHVAGRQLDNGGLTPLLEQDFKSATTSLANWTIDSLGSSGIARLVADSIMGLQRQGNGSTRIGPAPGVVNDGQAQNIPPYLEMHGGQVAITTRNGLAAGDALSLKVELALYRGAFLAWSGATIGGQYYSWLSERPDGGENLVLEYQKDDGTWVVAHTFQGCNAGDCTEGQFFNLTGSAAIPLGGNETPQSAAHSAVLRDGVKFRLRQVGASGSTFDYWHIARFNILKAGRWTSFVKAVNGAATSAPTIAANMIQFPMGAEVSDLATIGNGGDMRLVVHGNRYEQLSYGTATGACSNETAEIEGAFVASFAYGAGYSCRWSNTLAGAKAGGVAVGASATTLGSTAVYVTGAFANQLAFGGSVGTLIGNSTETTDAYAAAVDLSTGQWSWATGGVLAQGNPPSAMGGGGNDIGLAIAVQGAAAVYVGGRFEQVANFGPVNSLTSVKGGDGFMVKLRGDGSFSVPETWQVGVPITPPNGAYVDNGGLQPEFYVDDQPVQALGAGLRWFTWTYSGTGTRYELIPLQPTPDMEIRWRISDAGENTGRITTSGQAVWPSQVCTDVQVNGCYQVHVFGTPVEALPPSGQYQILEVVNPGAGSSNAKVENGLFTTSQIGTSVILYVQGPSIDTSIYPMRVEVVRTLTYTALPRRNPVDPATALFTDNKDAEIGKKLYEAYHNELNRTGWVINEKAYYDGAGTDAAYNRISRTGTIIPVNRNNSARTNDIDRELAVAWYRRKAKGVYWPERAVRYTPRWPYNPEKIVIASELGGEVFNQPPLTVAAYPQARIYVQNDRDLPGYNPNDEHAIMAPSSNGTGVDAVFALRADFGSNLPGDLAAASDPYVLIKYFASATQEWSYRIYKVSATGSGYNNFRYTGTAGTTVSPPYPVRLLPGCAESFVDGQAQGEQPPAPFYQDHKGQLWAKSAGSGKVHYFYPMQPGFFRDVDNNDQGDVGAGTCVPWLERLPVAQGGSGTGKPILVEYTIQWPETVPLLIAGETLLTPKRGLPDIMNQAAVSVVYDDLQHGPNADDPEPKEVLAQIISPLDSRWVRLTDPGEIGLTMRTDGFYDIDGLPASLSERMYYDQQNRRLVLTGVFDETGAGEPKLLLNILSKRERVLLKKLDGGDGSEQSTYGGDCSGNCTWDQAVEALYRLSRNPQRINKVCTTSTVDDEGIRHCQTQVSVDPENDMLAGFEDPLGNGVLMPLNSLGGGSALTAGAAQAEGYITLAFNDDESLGSLPVSLEVIKVGCLSSNATTPPIYAPYQGQINVIAPDDIFDEQLVLRHSGDFGGRPDSLTFEWFFHPDANGTPPPPPTVNATTGAIVNLNGWFQFPVENPTGALEISIEGANIQTLSDNWYLARYRGLPLCNNTNKWGLWAGQPGGTPTQIRAQLAEGWVKRVLARLNPFEARVQDFGDAETNNYVSMLIQLGERYAGPIALNSDPDNLNSIGLIEAYTTVMRRAMQLSVDSTPPVDYGPANAAILLVASRLVDFYTLLGNEAYADAQDPTIGIETTGGEYMSLAPSIFNFQNQLASPLEEELVLLRGRDDAHGPVAATPVFNRLFWNFTTGDGEVAYAISYNIADQDVNGVINEFDARIQFPQGHGDAWGHYLTAVKTYYSLLKHPYYSWNPQSEAVLVAGVPINVDFLDERQFAETAVAKARTGAEIVDLTYRSAFVEDPNGQWQGYEDTNAERAWGLSEWGRRAGMGAYFDWVTANAILPVEDANPTHVGIQRIARDSISELKDIHSQYAAIQGQVDKADSGLNPLGLAKGVVSFDIDPNQLIIWNKTQFEQVWERAMAALNNAVKLWDYANQLNNQLRRSQDSADEVWDASIDAETSFANQLIEIFGYPYIDDIGPGGTYPDGYNGPDLYHYMYVDKPALAGTNFDFDPALQGDSIGVERVKTKTGYYRPSANGVGFFNFTASQTLGGNLPGNGCIGQQAMADGCPLGDTPEGVLEVKYVLTENALTGLGFYKPAEWQGQRRAPGRLQQTQQEMLMAQIELKQAVLEYDKMRLDLEAKTNTLQATFNTSQSNINIAISQRNELKRLTIAVETMRGVATVARRVGETIKDLGEAASECVPDNFVAGLAVGGDLFSAGKCMVQSTAWVINTVAQSVGDVLDVAANATDAAKEDVTELNGIRTTINDANLDLYNIAGEIDEIMREEPMLRSEIFARMQALQQLQGDYNATLAEGMRIFDQLLVFRRSGAAETQTSRYRDMAFRIFRNDALAKYRAAFDLAARYVYLAASAYDYETNLLGSNARAGMGFLTDIVKERSLGQVLEGAPMTGTPGLANSMAQLKLNFDVLKGQMGFNNPQVETQRFSLRRELFRIEEGEDGDEEWRRTLEAARVADLRQLPEFRRYARPFAPDSAGPQPGLVFEFSTNVTSGLNFFGWDLGPYDSSYNASRFATRIRSVGAWFGNYASLPLADDPNVYLIPVGSEVLRSPDPLDFTVREWTVLDQKIPVPFPVGTQQIEQYDWVPTNTLDGARTDLRRYPMMRAYHFTEPFDDSQVTSDSRLIGRSVWNRKWLLIIPGQTFLNDAQEGLDTFIQGQRIPGGGSTRDGNGVDDIRIFFKTYSYSGN